MASLGDVCQLDAANCLSIHAVAVLVLLVALVSCLLGFSYNSSSTTSTIGCKLPAPAAAPEAIPAPAKVTPAVRAGTTTLHADPYLRVEVSSVLGWGTSSIVFKGEMLAHPSCMLIAAFSSACSRL